MSREGAVPGFYGKVPSHGDFLSRRLPRQFIEPWDEWLQAGLSVSREQLGDDWLETFLYSPIWQFALAPGLCGNDAWAGVMMPSVDRVGRYFPLTLAAKVNPWPLTALFEPECGWFAALTDLALASLDYDFDLDGFDERLAQLQPDGYVARQSQAYGDIGIDVAVARQALQYRLDRLQDTPQALRAIGDTFGQRFLTRCSYWRTGETKAGAATLLLCDGMPPIDVYAGFLNGNWPSRSWQLSYRQLAASAPATPVTAEEDITHCPDKNGRRAEVGRGWRVESSGLSVVGMRRKLNEDAILDRRDAGLWAVADGMGGHSAGDVASRALVGELAKMTRFGDLDRFRKQVEASLRAVNRELLQLAHSRGHGQIIGSTIVVLLIAGGFFRCLWAGDSRLYRYRNGVLEQLTQDHSFSSALGEQGGDAVDASGAPVHENVITRAVGADELLEIDCVEGEIADRDVYLLCSDGLVKELSDADIAARCALGSPDDIVKQLVHEAEQRGGRDNISVIVIEVAGDHAA